MRKCRLIVRHEVGLHFQVFLCKSLNLFQVVLLKPLVQNPEEEGAEGSAVIVDSIAEGSMVVDEIVITENVDDGTNIAINTFL